MASVDIIAPVRRETLAEAIAEKLIQYIGANRLRRGDKLPSERELGERYHISRMTARQALVELTGEGIVHREQGKGTFVAEPKILQSLSRLTGYTEDMHERTLRPGARVLRVEMVGASERAAESLHIPQGATILLLERLRMADGAPMAVEASHLHFDRVHELLGEDLKNASLYHLLTEKWGVIPTRAEQRRQTQLELGENAPVLKIRRTTYDQHGRPFEYVESTYRADRYVLHAELAAP